MGRSGRSDKNPVDPSDGLHKRFEAGRRRPGCMLKAEFKVCKDCGNLHMEGGDGPSHVDSCAICDGRVDDVELDDLVGL